MHNVPTRPCGIPWCVHSHAPGTPTDIHSSDIDGLDIAPATVSAELWKFDPNPPVVRVFYGPGGAEKILDIPIDAAAALGDIFDLMTPATVFDFGRILASGAAAARRSA